MTILLPTLKCTSHFQIFVNNETTTKTQPVFDYTEQQQQQNVSATQTNGAVPKYIEYADCESELRIVLVRQDFETVRKLMEGK